MKKIRKTISFNDFMSLWKNIESHSWDRIMPYFWSDVKRVWYDEIVKRFTQMKRGGSYGNVNDFVMRIMLKNTENTYLPRSMGYNPRYAQKYPQTYVKTGFLKNGLINVLKPEFCHMTLILSISFRA